MLSYLRLVYVRVCANGQSALCIAESVTIETIRLTAYMYVHTRELKRLSVLCGGRVGAWYSYR